MSKINDGGSAFPRPVGDNNANHPADRLWNGAQEGMSLRDWFAGRAMHARLTGVNVARLDIRHAIAADAYAIADAMLLARSRTDEDNG